jgi:hypothetical protein
LQRVARSIRKSIHKRFESAVWLIVEMLLLRHVRYEDLAPATPAVIEHRRSCHPIQPRPEVIAVRQPGIRPKGSEHRFLKYVLVIGRPQPADVRKNLVAVRFEQLIERR